jgi:tRNA(Ile)-lysidine synthase
VGRAAAHCATAQRLLDDLAALDARDALDGPRLRLAPLVSLDRDRRANVLRWWLARAGLERPSTARLDEMLRQMWTAPSHAQPVIRWKGGEVHRYRGVLHALRDAPAEIDAGQMLYPGTSIVPGAGLGTLSLSPALGQGLQAACCAAGLTLRPRHGGEEIRLHRGGPRRPLRLLLQEAGIVPWWRASLPLLWSGTELVAVADRWVSADHAAASGEPAYTVRWEGAPALS